MNSNKTAAVQFGSPIGPFGLAESSSKPYSDIEGQAASTQSLSDN